MKKTMTAGMLVALVAACGGDAEEATGSAATNGTTTGGPATGATSGSGAGGGTTTSGTTTATTGSGGSTTSSGSGGSGGDAGGWPQGDPADHGFDPQLLDDAAAVAGSYVSYCMAVIRHGVLVGEWYWNGSTPETKQTSWSIAKSYTSALVGIAIDNGDIASIDQSVADYVPEWQGTPRDQITIRHLLAMDSGLQWDMFTDYVGMAVFSSDHTDHALQRQVTAPPGQEWVYNNAAVQIFEPLFRNATGKTLEEYGEEHLWSKVGMSAEWAKDPAGNVTAYASVRASCRDHAKFGYLYMNGGVHDGTQVVPSQFVTDSLVPSQPMNQGYGYLWWLNQGPPAMDAMMAPWPTDTMMPFAPPDWFAAIGFGNQFIDVIPSLDLIVVRFGDDPLGTFNMQELMDDQKEIKHKAILEAVLQSIVN